MALIVLASRSNGFLTTAEEILGPGPGFSLGAHNPFPPPFYSL